MMVGDIICGKAGVTRGARPGEALRSPEDTGGASVDMGGTGGGETDTARGVTD